MLDFPLMLRVKLSVVDRIHPQSNKFVRGVDRLGKASTKGQQLSRTQHFIFSSHAAMFVLHTIQPMRNTAGLAYDTTTELSPINVGEGELNDGPVHVT